MRILPANETIGFDTMGIWGPRALRGSAGALRRYALNSRLRTHARALLGLCLLVTAVGWVQTLGAAETTAKRALPSVYRIDTGDRVSITVYQEPDLSVREARVKVDGTIAFPLLGDIQVAGLTSQELQAMVTSKLLDGYLKKPSVTVSIDGYRLYYIKGEVTRPGGYSFVDGLTVAKAVAVAGGFTVRASETHISLVRESNPDQPLDSVGLNTPILPGDVITVGESFF